MCMYMYVPVPYVCMCVYVRVWGDTEREGEVRYVRERGIDNNAMWTG